MFYPSSTICFVQGAPFRLHGHLRSLELLGRSRLLLRSMPFSRTNFKSCMAHIPHYPDVAKIRPLTIDDYHVLIEAGNLDDERVELLNGLLITMHPQSVEHADAVWYLNDILSQKLRNRAVVRPSLPITLANSEPEPDIVIASGVRGNYRRRHPAAEDILLLIEVSNSTFHRDSTNKLELYASENIPEYWIVDITSRSVRVFLNPQGKCYLHHKTFFAGDIAPATFPDVVVSVEKLF